MQNLVIEEIKQIKDEVEELSNLLKTVVDDGASIGFYLHWNKRINKVLANCFSARSDLICC